MIKLKSTQTPRDIYNHRIIGMMADYGISMSDAMAWDFESFHYNLPKLLKAGGVDRVENAFRTYLGDNDIRAADLEWYCDVFVGRVPDLALRKNVDAEEKDN